MEWKGFRESYGFCLCPLKVSIGTFAQACFYNFETKLVEKMAGNDI